MGSCFYKEKHTLDIPTSNFSCKNYDKSVECKVPEYEELNTLLDNYSNFLTKISKSVPSNEEFVNFIYDIRTLEILTVHYNNCDRNDWRYKELNELRIRWYNMNISVCNNFITKLNLDSELITSKKREVLQEHERKLERERRLSLKCYKESPEFKNLVNNNIIIESIKNLNPPPKNKPFDNKEDILKNIINKNSDSTDDDDNEGSGHALLASHY